MDCMSQNTETLYSHKSNTLIHVCCVPQILVIDRQNGPADIFMDIVGKVANRDLCITTAFDQQDAAYALAHGCFDLIVMGLDDLNPDLLDMIPAILAQTPELPVVVIGDRSLNRCIESIQKFGAREYLPLPDRM